MKTYVITLSTNFPSTHPRKGDPTYFKEQLFNAIFRDRGYDIRGAYPQHGHKIHTIRANYSLWAKRFEQIEKGEACLSIRRWTGKPYRSEQYEMARLTKDDGIGIQKLEFRKVFSQCRTVRPAVGDTYIDAQSLASNDGLSLFDWTSWFENYDKSKPLVIIHFTKFRY